VRGLCVDASDTSQHPPASGRLRELRSTRSAPAGERPSSLPALCIQGASAVSVEAAPAVLHPSPKYLVPSKLFTKFQPTCEATNRECRAPHHLNVRQRVVNRSPLYCEPVLPGVCAAGGGPRSPRPWARWRVPSARRDGHSPSHVGRGCRLAASNAAAPEGGEVAVHAAPRPRLELY